VFGGHRCGYASECPIELSHGAVWNGGFKYANVDIVLCGGGEDEGTGMLLAGNRH
jgi:hypothetical protein